MSRINDFDNDDYPTAVAATAFAIHSLDQSKSRGKNVKTYGHGKSLNKTRSKADKKRNSALSFSDETSKQSLKNPDNKMSEKRAGPSPSFQPKISFFDTYENPEWMERPSTFADNKHLKDDDVRKSPDQSPLPIPENPEWMERPSTFADNEHLKDDDVRKSPDQSPLPIPDSLLVGNPTAQPAETTRQSETKPGPVDSMADAWEKEEMASINERYDRLRATINNWEIKKRKNADHKLQTIEGKPEKSIEQRMQSYHHEIKRIKEIAAEARSHAETKRMKEELKVKEKANKIRSTGKLPTTCLCF